MPVETLDGRTMAAPCLLSNVILSSVAASATANVLYPRDHFSPSRYRDMLTTVRERVARSIRVGKSLEQAIAAKPTAEFDAQWGSPDHMLFVQVIYAELAERN